MRAWQVHQFGELRDVLALADDVPDPEPGPGQVFVRVLAAPANFPDVLMCQGTYQVKPPLPFTPGVELCGEVVALGPGVTGLAPGQRVVGVAAMPAGAFGEVAIMDAAGAFPAPERFDDAEAAAFYISYQTGWFGLHRRARLAAGETLLVHAAAGGVGSAAVQLGKAAGARVIGVVGGEEKASAARALGADVVVDRYTEDFVPVVKEVTEGRGADVIYDPVGGDAYDRSTKCVAFEGRILVIGFAGGRVPTRPSTMRWSRTTRSSACTGVFTAARSPGRCASATTSCSSWPPTARSSRWSASGWGWPTSPTACSGWPTAGPSAG